MQKKPRLSPVDFPPAWTWWSDELIPTWVKRNYSPKDSWKAKPFNAEDARFFSQGIEDLSELFTDARPKDLAGYFKHPKYRSSYLLYFLPLQAAKFMAVLQQTPRALDAALQQAASSKRPLRILDVGAGPGTASFGLLFALLERSVRSEGAFEIPSIEFHWMDTQEGILKDGASLLAEFTESFPRLRGRVKTFLHPGDWLWPKKTSRPRSSADSSSSQPNFGTPELEPAQFDLVLLGNVLNESQHPGKLAPPLDELRAKTGAGGGVLIIEPAFKASAQRLGQVRDTLVIEREEKENDSSQESQDPDDLTPPAAPVVSTTQSKPSRGAALWGPCLHAGRCPLAQGRDWCHFSVPVEIPGRWFRGFSKGLGSERNWLKYSYLWLASPLKGADPAKTQERLIVSDTLPAPRSGDSSVLICEPELTRRWILPSKTRRFRGERVFLGPEKALPSEYRGEGPSRSFRADETKDPAGPPKGASGAKGGREQVGKRGRIERRSPADTPHKRPASSGRRARDRS